MDGGAEIGNSGRRGLYRANQLARAAVHALSSHLTSPVPLSVRQSWLSRARRTHSQALHPAQLRMGLAALARGERRMMPLGMLPYLLWPTRTALQARCRDRLARDLRHHLLCTVGVLYGARPHAVPNIWHMQSRPRFSIYGYIHMVYELRILLLPTISQYTTQYQESLPCISLKSHR